MNGKGPTVAGRSFYPAEKPKFRSGQWIELRSATHDVFPKIGTGHFGVKYPQSLQAVQDALHGLNRTWRLPIIIALRNGPERFRELQRLVTGIADRRLKGLTMNKLAIRHGYATRPVAAAYAYA